MRSKAARYIKPADFLFIALFAIIIVLSAASIAGRTSNGAKAVIRVKNSEYIYPLNSSKILRFKGEMGESVLIIENNTIRFEDSPCKEKICIRMGRAEKEGDFLACLPNRITVTIESDPK